MNEFDELISRDGVLLAGRFGPDGRIAEHKDKGLFIEYPPAVEMAESFCAAVNALFNTMAYAMNSQSPMADWWPVKGWALRAGDYTGAVHGDRFVFAETEKITSFDELRRLLSE